MKIIISHDVDHLFSSDHVFSDLILEKMFVRSILQLLKGEINLKTCFYRCTMIFHNRMNRIDEVMEYDKRNGIPSTFFFGMSNVLGMSYSKRRAMPFIKKVMDNGFDAGVHGCEYIDKAKMLDEYKSFINISGKHSFGIRNHYVRFDEQTFEKLSEIGYVFDTSYFNKKETELINPFKVGDMWEFPLHIMDGYICKQGHLEQGISDTKQIIMEAYERNIKYCTILFHDYQFDDVFDPQTKKWYESIVDFCIEKGFEFISYNDAIKELENEYTVCK